MTRAALAAVSLFVALFAAIACVSSDFAEGTFTCDPDRAPECPTGLSCARDGWCRVGGSLDAGLGSPDAADAFDTSKASDADAHGTGLLLLGSSRNGGAADVTGSGAHARAFRFVATGTGNVGRLSVQLDPTNRATDIEIGLYSESFAAPSQLLAKGRIAPAVAGWSSVEIVPARVTAGQPYWIAIVSRTAAVPVTFNQDTLSGATTKSNDTIDGDVTALPPWWSPGTDGQRLPLCAYGATL